MEEFAGVPPVVGAFAGDVPAAGAALLAAGVEGVPAFESLPSAAGVVAAAGLLALDPSHPNP